MKNFSLAEDQIDRCLQIESDLLARKIGFGDSLLKGRIPWLISPDGYQFSQAQVQELNKIGFWAKRFLEASVKLYQQEPSVRRILDMGKPAPVLEFQKQALKGGQLPRLFRVDLLLMPDGTFKVGEFSLKPGGTGITAGLQEVYRGKMVGRGILDCYKRLLDEGGKSLLIAVAQEKNRSLNEFEGLSFMLKRDGYQCRCGYPEDNKVIDGDAFYNYLPPRTWLQYRDFLNQAVQRSKTMIPPTYVFLKEKALFGLFWEAHWEKWWAAELGQEGFCFLKDKLIETAIFDHRGKFSLPDHELSFKELLELTTSQRARYLVKLSGFSHGSSGAKGVVLGKEVGRTNWQQVVKQAKESFSRQIGLYVLQPFITSQKVPVNWLDWNESGIKTEQRYLRVLAYYFVFDDMPVLAGVEVNSSDRSKVHLQTDVTSVPGILT
ncbi:MAG: hypothetical protein Q8P32_03895 [Candidatus Komeilibacteria bacterium]|nr:hypothetical protein [Candidatus Komeilibacteria bacterium]